MHIRCTCEELSSSDSEVMKLTQFPRRALSHQQELLQQVQKCEDHQAARSPPSGMSSEDLAPYLGERWQREESPRVPAEVGM